MTSESISQREPATVPAPASDRRELGAALLLAVVLLCHLVIAGWNWSSTGLVHNGFREAQTAISAHFIQREQNFSLAYPTPVLGPPWSIPMEFPLYQWTVVVVSDLTGIALPQAGKWVGLLCFYLALPAFYLVLGRIPLVRWQRLLVLAMVVSCPLYLFYARAFLIETMALLFSAWFLLGYVRAGETGRSAWFALALGAGVLAALVKVTTFLFFLLPAAAWSLHWLWQDWRTGGDSRRAMIMRRMAWCVPAAWLPVGVALLWVAFADGIKAQSIAGAFLQSENLREFNYGLGRRFEADVWRQHKDIWLGDLMPWPVFAAWMLLAILFARRWWRHLLVAFACFLIVQVIFPLLYAFHAYYYVANAWILMMAVGLVAVALLESRLPRFISWLVVAGMTLGQVAYAAFHYRSQLSEEKPGNLQLIEAIQQSTNAEDVLIIAGDDWSSVLPYYAERRALMLRTGVEDDREYLAKAFASLRGHKVGALLVRGNQRFNAALIGQVRDMLLIDGEPAFSWNDMDVYVAQGARERVMAKLLGTLESPEIEVKAWQTDRVGKEVAYAEVPPRYQWLFAGINPLPWQYFTGAPLARYEQEQRSYFDAQPPKRLWFRLPAGKHLFSVEIGVLPGAYADSLAHGDRTDGIEVVLAEERPGEAPRVIYTQEVNPRDRYDQRGMMKLKHEFTLEADTNVVFSVNAGPRNNAARDWTIMGPLSFR